MPHPLPYLITNTPSVGVIGLPSYPHFKPFLQLFRVSFLKLGCTAEKSHKMPALPCGNLVMDAVKPCGFRPHFVGGCRHSRVPACRTMRPSEACGCSRIEEQPVGMANFPMTSVFAVCLPCSFEHCMNPSVVFYVLLKFQAARGLLHRLLQSLLRANFNVLQ